jgi:hypothetical protein
VQEGHSIDPPAGEGLTPTYRNLPEDVGRRLIEEGVLPAPNEIIDSAEGGFRIPGIESKSELDDLVEQLRNASTDVAEELLRDYAAAARENGGPPQDVDVEVDEEER